MTWMVGWRTGGDSFLAFGPDRELLPAYGVLGAIRNPDVLDATDLLFPSCLKMMPYAEPVVDLAEINEAEAEKLERRIATAERLQGLGLTMISRSPLPDPPAGSGRSCCR